MTSIQILENNLREIESLILNTKIEIEALKEEAEEKLALREAKILNFNDLDEETVEIKEAIELLKENQNI